MAVKAGIEGGNQVERHERRQASSPPITASASGRCSSAPAPRPSASGSSPNSVQSVVIRIGRSRTRAASYDRFVRRHAAVALALGEVQQHDAVLDDQADSRISPIADETFRSVPVRSAASERAAERQRRRAEDQDAPAERAELHDEDDEHQRGRRSPRRAAARGTPAAATRTGRRLPTCSRPAASCRAASSDLGDRAAEVAVFEPGADERHLPQVLALARFCPSLGTTVASAESGASCAVGAAHRASRPAVAGSKRTASG